LNSTEFTNACQAADGLDMTSIAYTIFMGKSVGLVKSRLKKEFTKKCKHFSMSSLKSANILRSSEKNVVMIP